MKDTSALGDLQTVKLVFYTELMCLVEKLDLEKAHFDALSTNLLHEISDIYTEDFAACWRSLILLNRLYFRNKRRFN